MFQRTLTVQRGLQHPLPKPVPPGQFARSQHGAMGVSSAFRFLYPLAVLRIYGTGIAEKRVVSEDATALYMEEDATVTAPCVVGLGQE